MSKRETFTIFSNQQADAAGDAITDADKFESLVIQVVTTGNFTGDIDFYESSSGTEPTWTLAASQSNRYSRIAIKDKSDQSWVTSTLQPAGTDIIKEFAVLDSKNIRNFNAVISNRTQGAVYITAYGKKRESF